MNTRQADVGSGLHNTSIGGSQVNNYPMPNIDTANIANNIQITNNGSSDSSIGSSSDTILNGLTPKLVIN